MRVIILLILGAFMLFQPLAHAGAPASQPADAKTSKSAEKTARDNAGKEEKKENVTTQIQDQAWEAMWSGQRKLIDEMRQTALKMSDSFSEQTANLSKELRPFEEEARRLLVFANTFSGHPNAMEAVSRRMGATITELDQVLNPVTLARSEAQALLERVNQMALSLPPVENRAGLSEEMSGYINDITRARLRLTAVLAQYDSLLPSLGLVRQLEESRKAIAATLPELWKAYYLQKPLPWLSPERWVNADKDMYYSLQALMLRLPVEIPGNQAQWWTALLRFVICLFFAGTLALIFKQRIVRHDSPPGLPNIFRVGIPWLILGFSILGSAISSTGDFFRMFVALGSASIILGQVFIAWDLRRLQLPDMPKRRPPFIRLVPMAFLGYGLLYLPITEPLALVIWSIILVYFIYRHRRKQPRPGLPSFETGTLDCLPILNWICLFLALSGLAIYSIIAYIAYVALAVAIELAIGGMAVVGRINEHLPQEGARAALARLLVAMAAPFVLVLAVAGICIWEMMLPGGTYILAEYALKGVRIGATQFNIIQILLIISAFYLTRTIVSMGTRFLARLPRQGTHFDTTLITPLQTFFTYATWAIFGLFVLRALGMELSSLAMVAGGLSVGIGFGMQTIVNNFLSGLILIFGRTLQVGDVIEVGGLAGRVRKISVRATMVETYDNAIIFVPNSEFMSGRLINWTSFSRSVRREVTVGVAYGSDTEKVVNLLIQTATAHKDVLQYPKPSVNFINFGTSTLDFQLRFWVKDYELGTNTMSDIRLAINKVFNEHNIDIAFPQLDVHIKDEPCSQMRKTAQFAKKNATLPALSRRPGNLPGKFKKPGTTFSQPRNPRLAKNRLAASATRQNSRTAG